MFEMKPYRNRKKTKYLHKTIFSDTRTLTTDDVKIYFGIACK